MTEPNLQDPTAPDLAPVDQFLLQLRRELPEGWARLTPKAKMHSVIHAANRIIDTPGDWVLIDASWTLGDILKQTRPPG